MITTKEIQLVPGVRVHTVGHLRVKLLELSPEECYVLPEAISIYNTGDYSVISSAGNRGHYIEKSYFYTISALRSLLSSHLNLCEEYFSEGQEYFGLPLISRPTCLDHSEVVSGYALPETLMTSMSYLDSLEYITKTLIPGLVRNQYRDKEYNEEQIGNFIFFGNYMSRILEDNGVEYVSKFLDLSPNRLRSMRASGKVNYTWAVKLRKLYSDDAGEFFKRLQRINEFSLETLVERQGRTGADVCRAIRIARIARGLSIFDMYKLTGLGETTLNKFETGMGLPSYDSYVRILEALETTIAGSVHDSYIMEEYINNLVRTYNQL